jgi:hypothetical protein
MAEAEADWRRWMAELRATSGPAQYALAARERLTAWVQLVEDQVLAGDSGSIDEALAYLRSDPYYFRSGYSRDRLAGRIARAALTEAQRAEARTFVLLCVDGLAHCRSRELGRLAGATADNALRRDLLDRLRSKDRDVVRRAIRVVARIRRPDLTDADRAVARQLVIEDAARSVWLTREVDRLARWLWSREWEDELRGITRHHGPGRAAAKRILAAADARRKKRPGPSLR